MNKVNEEDEELLAELGIEIEDKENSIFTAREERIIAGFDEIQQFVEEKGRIPSFGENKDIFERIYATVYNKFKDRKNV